MTDSTRDAYLQSLAAVTSERMTMGVRWLCLWVELEDPDVIGHAVADLDRPDEWDVGGEG